MVAAEFRVSARFRFGARGFDRRHDAGLSVRASSVSLAPKYPNHVVPVLVAQVVVIKVDRHRVCTAWAKTVPVFIRAREAASAQFAVFREFVLARLALSLRYERTIDVRYGLVPL
jgi:hypothetical protein